VLKFQEFLVEAAAKGEAVNPVFEERLFTLIGILHKISALLTAENISHELIGGLAVLVHVEEADPAHSMLTRDVDLMIGRSDLQKVIAIAERHGFRFRHSAGLDMLLYGDSDKARNAVHLLYSGEKVRPTQAVPNPAIAPERKRILGEEFSVIRLPDLVRMKLSSYRLKDQVHVQVMDAAGLISRELEESLPQDLRLRLQHVRESE
jgi:hypothetical protein